MKTLDDLKRTIPPGGLAAMGPRNGKVVGWKSGLKFESRGKRSAAMRTVMQAPKNAKFPRLSDLDASIPEGGLQNSRLRSGLTGKLDLEGIQEQVL